MTEPNFLVQQEGLNLATAIESIVKRSCIIDYGIIQKVVADGVVDVSVAVARTDEDMICMTCVLANVASSSITVNVVPHEGDRVLVVYPRIYDDKMFNVEEGDEGKELIVNYEAKGYNLMSGIAVLLNQYKENKHKNVIKIEDGSVELELDKKCELKIDDKGYLSYKTTSNDDSKTKLEFTSSGMTLQDKNGNTIVSSAPEGGDAMIVINGNLKVKK